MPHLIPNSKEWVTAWALLAKHPLNVNLPDPESAFNCYETWEYMGTADGKHTFRHRLYPSTGKREYIHVAVSCKVQYFTYQISIFQPGPRKASGYSHREPVKAPSPHPIL